MTYFGFLARFLVLPILLVGSLLWVQRRRKTNWGWDDPLPPWVAVGLHALIALIYTTPWDNYLVATRVWWYDPALVTGITIGWVPIEEYTFFILQPILAGLWLLLLIVSLPTRPAAEPLRASLRKWTTLAAGGIWIGAIFLLLTPETRDTYLALELVWALPPIALQLFFGADVLWRERRLVGLAIIPLTLYLSLADSLAIRAGTWTISPGQSFEFLLGGILPVEEFIFFLLTNTLVVFGLTLIRAPESRPRLRQLTRRFGRTTRQNVEAEGRRETPRAPEWSEEPNY